MVSKKTRQKIMKHRICSVARIVACVSFLTLTIIGVSSVVRAMSLETIANENGIPPHGRPPLLATPKPSLFQSPIGINAKTTAMILNANLNGVNVNFTQRELSQGSLNLDLGPMDYLSPHIPTVPTHGTTPTMSLRQT